jgi:hypothetical protein
VAEGARLESVYTLTGIQGSNPCLSAIPSFFPAALPFNPPPNAFNCIAILHGAEGIQHRTIELGLMPSYFLSKFIDTLLEIAPFLFQ